MNRNTARLRIIFFLIMSICISVFVLRKSFGQVSTLLQESYNTFGEQEEEPIFDYYDGKDTKYFMYSEDTNEKLGDYNRCLEKHPKEVETYAKYKHGGEVHFLRNLESSSWRTFDKDKASVIVVPIHFGMIEDKAFQLCKKLSADFLKSIKLDEKHIVMTTNHKVELNSICSKCIQIRDAVEKDGKSCQVVAPMNSQLHREENAGKFTSDISPMLIDWRQRRYAFYFGGRANGPEYTHRLRIYAHFSQIRDSVTLGEVAEYHLLSSVPWDPYYLTRMLNTKIGLHIAGPSLNSQRLYEWVEVGSFVVIMADGFYERAAPGLHIPWKDFTDEINGLGNANFSHISPSLVKISNLPEEMMLRKVKMMRKFKNRLLWNITGSKVAETLLIDAAEKCILNLE